MPRPEPIQVESLQDGGILDRFADNPSPQRRRDRRRLRIVLTCLGVCLLLVLGVTVAGAWLLERHLTGQIGTIPNAFAGLTNRPVKPTVGTAGRATNILLVGSDRRSPVQTTGSRAAAAEWLPGAQRSDTLMLVHVSGDRRNVTVVSIPRDSWVPIPGHGMAKINAAFSWGGPSLLVGTVEGLTGVRIDHLAVVDWDGFRRLTDALGGVDVTVARTVYDPARRHTWTAGVHHLDGAQALLYVRQREGLPAGDLDRVQRQQNLLRLLVHKAFATSVWSDPVRHYKMLSAITANLSTDSGWTVHQIGHLARQLSDLTLDDFYFTTAPITGTGRVGSQDVVFLAGAADHRLWHALEIDHAPAWFDQHPGAQLPTTID
jgi:LCP family protein required for cell wall assembly